MSFWAGARVVLDVLVAVLCVAAVASGAHWIYAAFAAVWGLLAGLAIYEGVLRA